MLGPVKPSFGDGVPRWVVRGGFFDRPCYKTGFVLAPGQTRTGNVLLKGHALRGTNSPFRPEFRVRRGRRLFQESNREGACLHLVQ